MSKPNPKKKILPAGLPPVSSFISNPKGSSKNKSGDVITNIDQEGLDLLQKIAKMSGKSALSKVPFSVGATTGLVQSAANGQPANYSDLFGLAPNGYAQAAAYTMMYAEKEKENLEKFAENKMRGKDLTKLKPKKETNLIVKDAISNTKPLEIKKKTKSTTPVTSKISTKVLRNVLGTLMPDQAAQFLSAITTQDNKLGIDDLTPDIKEALIKSIKNAQKRTGKDSGGTQYADFGPEVEQTFQHMQAGPDKMLSVDPSIQAASMIGRVSYKKNAKGETEIYDSYDFSKTDPNKANTLYKKIRTYAGEVLPDEGKEPNLIGKIPATAELAFGTNSQGIMKNKMNPRKKYANGSNSGGVTTSGIPTPAATLNDYNIMMAKVEHEAATNKWLPIVAMVGGLAQQAIGTGANASGKTGTTGANSLVEKEVPPVATNKIMASNENGVVAATGMNNVNKDVEVEGGEMYETPQGQTGEFKGPSHEQGGIPLEVNKDVPEGTKVYSDRLKVGNKTLAERKATRERQTANLEKIASNNLADQAVKNAAKRKMQAIEKEEAADLDFQEKVNNVQAMADTMVQAFACGTGMKGIQKMDNGGIVYGPGYDESMFKDFYTKYNELNPGAVMDMKYIQGDLGMSSKTGGFGKVFGPGTYKASQDWLAANKDKKPDSYVSGDFNGDGVEDSLGNNPNINLDALKNFKIGDGINDNASLDYGDPYAKDGVNFEMPPNTVMTPVSAYGNGVDTENAKDTTGKKEPSLFMKTVGENMPAIGDMTKLIGNYLGMTSGIKTATEQRASDVTHQNTFANAGKESQTYLDKAIANVEGMKTAAEIKATTAGRSSKFSANNSARGVNQRRAMDWLYDTALQSQIADISAKAAEQISGINVQKSGVAMNADQLKGTGQYQADMANEAAKDAYYTALGLGRKDFATGLQQTGKDLNTMKENKIIEGLMKQYGTYFIGDKSGIAAKSFEDITGGKNAKSTKEEVFLGPDGKTKFKLGKNNQLIQVTT